MKKVSTMKELNEEINKQLKQILNRKNNEIADVIKITESIKVEEEVYQAYGPNDGEPWEYERRGLNGGLADTDNMYHEAIESNGKVNMKVMNLTPPNEKYNTNNLKRGEVAQLVEGGHGYMGLRYDTYREDYGKPREFQKKTVEELINNKGHVYALKNELERSGIKTKM